LHRDTSNPSMLLSLFMIESKLFSSFFEFTLMPLLHTPTTNMTCQDIRTTHEYLIYMYPIGIQSSTICCLQCDDLLRSSFKGQWSSISNMWEKACCNRHFTIQQGDISNSHNIIPNWEPTQSEWRAVIIFQWSFPIIMLNSEYYIKNKALIIHTSG
jgi:hypothetical protein